MTKRSKNRPVPEQEANLYRSLLLVYRKARLVIRERDREDNSAVEWWLSMLDPLQALDEALVLAKEVFAKYGLDDLQDNNLYAADNLTGWPPEKPKAGGGA